MGYFQLGNLQGDSNHYQTRITCSFWDPRPVHKFIAFITFWVMTGFLIGQLAWYLGLPPKVNQLTPTNPSKNFITSRSERFEYIVAKQTCRKIDRQTTQHYRKRSFLCQGGTRILAVWMSGSCFMTNVSKDKNSVHNHSLELEKYSGHRNIMCHSLFSLSFISSYSWARSVIISWNHYAFSYLNSLLIPYPHQMLTSLSNYNLIWWGAIIYESALYINEEKITYKFCL